MFRAIRIPAVTSRLIVGLSLMKNVVSGYVKGLA